MERTLSLSELKRGREEYRAAQGKTLSLKELQKGRDEYRAAKKQTEVAPAGRAQNASTLTGTDIDTAVANIEKQLSEARAANVSKAAGAAAKVLGKAASSVGGALKQYGESRAVRIVNAGDESYTPQEVNPGTQAKIDAIGASSRLKKGTELYAHQAKLVNEYLNADTAEKQAAAKAQLDELQKDLPGDRA